jgi:hypothetical protein
MAEGSSNLDARAHLVTMTRKFGCKGASSDDDEKDSHEHVFGKKNNGPVLSILSIIPFRLPERWKVRSKRCPSFPFICLKGGKYDQSAMGRGRKERFANRIQAAAAER